MKQATKLRICNLALAVMTLITLVSSIQLEVLSGSSIGWVWVHIGVATLFIILVGWHLYLHFQRRNWIKLLAGQKSPVTRWLAIFCALTIISAFVASTHWLTSYTHSPIGAVHGKLGFVFIALAIAHTIKRIRFFKPRKQNRR